VADQGAPPFWPWRTLVPVDPPDVPASTDDAIGALRFERLTALGDQVRARARERPRLHVIEDLQWADVASVLLLVHVGATIVDLPIMILATLRTGELLGRQLDEAIEEVRRSAAAVREMAPLSAEAIELLIHDAGIEADSELASVVRARTGGNPLFVTELLRSARAPDAGDRLHEVVAGGVPGRVSELVDQRCLPDHEGIVEHGVRRSERALVARRSCPIQGGVNELPGPAGLIREVELGGQSGLEEDRRGGALARLGGEGSFEQRGGHGVVGPIGDAEVGAGIRVAERGASKEGRVLRQLRRVEKRSASVVELTHVTVRFPDSHQQLGPPPGREIWCRRGQRLLEPADRFFVRLMCEG
jgi:hypothetical protein